MDTRRPLISFDWAMKRLLRQKANYEILEGFLSTLLKQPLKIDTLLESESNRQSSHGKFNKVDLLCRSQDGSLIIIELQFESEIDYFQRMLFGTSALLMEYIEGGAEYDQIKKVYSVNIVYFSLGQGDDYVYHGTTQFRGIHNPQDVLQLSERQKQQLSKKSVHDIFPEYYIIKVNNFDDVATDPLDEWIYYFQHNRLPENYSAPGLALVAKQLRVDDMSSEDYIAYKRAIHDARVEFSIAKTARIEGYDKGLAEGRAEGIAEGRSEGRSEGRAEGIAEGREEGRTEGIAEGRLAGRLEGVRPFILYLHGQGKSMDKIAGLSGISSAEVRLIIEGQ